MDVNRLRDFVQHVAPTDRTTWEYGPLLDLAGLQVPSEVLGPNAWLLEADIRIAWTKWFVPSVINRAKYVSDDRLCWSNVYAETRRNLRRSYPQPPDDEIAQAARVISDVAWLDIERSRVAGVRDKISRVVREDLWLSNEPGARCYLCGREFDGESRDDFLGRVSAHTRQLPEFVDFTRPVGLVGRDYKIEIDHLLPVADGGDAALENLRLSCGWCNRVKGARSNIYQSFSNNATRSMHVKELGTTTIPDALWVLRIVATRRRCDHAGGCVATLANSELYAAPRDADQELTPVTAGVFCRAHDPWKTARYVSRTRFADRHLG